MGLEPEEAVGVEVDWVLADAGAAGNVAGSFVRDDAEDREEGLLAALVWTLVEEDDSDEDDEDELLS